MAYLAEVAYVLEVSLSRELALFEVVYEIEVAVNGHIHIKRRYLGEIADIRLRLFRLIEDISTVYKDLSGGR